MPPGERKNILVVDSDEDMLIALEWLLDGEGYHVTTAWSGRECLALLRSAKFDLVLLDDHLPDLNCREMLRALHHEQNTTPVIVMHGVESKDNEVDQSLSWGACDVVNKQIPHEISQAINKCLLPVTLT